MGAGIVILFWLVIAAIYGLFWFRFLAIFLNGKRRKSRILAWLGGIPLALSTGLAVIGVGALIYGMIYVSIPANVYKMSFGMRPPADVTNMRSRYWTFADIGTTYLKFNATPTTIHRLTEKRWTRYNDLNALYEDSFLSPNDDKPSWWTTSDTNTTFVYGANNRFGNFAGENEILTYDTKTNQAYYAFVGID